jgi:sugar phosphate isomerase/epimerase
MTGTLAPGLCTRDTETESSLEWKILGMRASGFQHCHVSSFPAEACDADLEYIRTVGWDAGVSLSVGIGQINPSRPHRAATALAAGNGELKLGLRHLLDGCKKLGATQAHFTVGTLEDRQAQDVPWPEQLRHTADLLQDLAAHAADLDLELVLKTHEEMTTLELSNLLTEVGSRYLGAGFSPVNVLLRLEHPLRSLYRLAPHLKAVMVDDSVLHWNRHGIQRSLVPFGQGDIPWPEILARVSAGRSTTNTPVILDIHRAELGTAAFEGSHANQTDSTPRELAELFKLVRPGVPDAPASPEVRFKEGSEELLSVIKSLKSWSRAPIGT